MTDPGMAAGKGGFAQQMMPIAQPKEPLSFADRMKAIAEMDLLGPKAEIQPMPQQQAGVPPLMSILAQLGRR